MFLFPFAKTQTIKQTKLYVVTYGCQIWPVTIREAQWPAGVILEDDKKFGPKRNIVTGIGEN